MNPVLNRKGEKIVCEKRLRNSKPFLYQISQNMFKIIRMKNRRKSLGSKIFEYFKYPQTWKFLTKCLLATSHTTQQFSSRNHGSQGNLMANIFPILKRVGWNYKNTQLWWPSRIKTKLLKTVCKYLKDNYVMRKDYCQELNIFFHCNSFLLQRKSYNIQREKQQEGLFCFFGLWDLSTWHSLKKVLYTWWFWQVHS